MIPTVGLQAAMIIGEPDWDFTLRNPSHYGKNGMVGPGWMVRTAAECVESYQKVQLPSRRPPKNSSFGPTRTQETKENAASEK